MKFYDSTGPNPHIVRMFMHEKGVSCETVAVDLRGGENRREPYLSQVNPWGQLPALELDDGQIIVEVVAICEYLDEITDGPSLIGDSPAARANTRMWVRRIDLNVMEPLLDGFRYAEGLPLFRDRIVCIPEAAEKLKEKARNSLSKLDRLIGASPFVAGDRLSLADITLYCLLTFAQQVGQPLDESNRNLSAWFGRMQARDSAAA